MSAADKFRRLAETIVLGNDERMKQDLEAAIRREQEAAAKHEKDSK